MLRRNRARRAFEIGRRAGARSNARICSPIDSTGKGACSAIAARPRQGHALPCCGGAFRQELAGDTRLAAELAMNCKAAGAHRRTLRIGMI
jgi:hypothetical protein